MTPVRQYSVLSTLQRLKYLPASIFLPRRPVLVAPSFSLFLASETGRKVRKPLLVRTISTREEKMTLDDLGMEQLFFYTSGRWLWDEEQQLRDRYKALNVAQLQTLASQATGSDGCASITKLAEGGFNKVFRLQMNDGKAILARIPNPDAGPPFYTTASEVATMEFVSLFPQQI
ncbi:hypothetical protein N7539_008803 [Penicillium diatomitis]|uniref:Altered inheritance of mitochondria protein 9, mitochondrial n=1 Tax=Penicillium diatomitis TaxID=2819901 RepID=A0A9X0BLM5_9EURO|nr:uncharacterized protein N7539_008803 [Penicillium diatomitis]KAJ5471860.1 hypothetical protein N7539_008803 [Penicillium diatomitis]